MPLENPPTTPTAPLPSPGRPLWKSKMLGASAVMMIVGLATWMLRPAVDAPPSSAPTSTVGSSFGETTGKAESKAKPAPALRPKPPVLFRFGSSFIAAYFLGYAFRKFLKWSLIVSGAVLAGIFVLRKFGVFDLDWGAVEGQVSESVSWAHGRAGALKDFLTGYLPSAGAAVVGLFMGARRG